MVYTACRIISPHFPKARLLSEREVIQRVITPLLRQNGDQIWLQKKQTLSWTGSRKSSRENFSFCTAFLPRKLLTNRFTMFFPR